MLKPEVESQVLKEQSAQAFHHDQHIKHRDFSIGQHVMVRNFHSGPAWLPGKVVRVLGPVSYLVHVGNSVAWKRHVDHIKGLVENLTAMNSTATLPVSSSSEPEDLIVPESSESTSTNDLVYTLLIVEEVAED